MNFNMSFAQILGISRHSLYALLREDGRGLRQRTVGRPAAPPNRRTWSAFRPPGRQPAELTECGARAAGRTPASAGEKIPH